MFDAPATTHDFAPRPTEEEKARAAALRLLTLRPRTVAEMRQRLAQRFSRDMVEKTVTALQSEGLLNDAAFAHQWRDSRERRKPRSRSMIQRELKQRGVAEEVINDALEGFDSHAAAYAAASRYAARQTNNGRAVFDRRVGAFLSRRGFAFDVIRRTLEQLREELDIGGYGTGAAFDEE